MTARTHATSMCIDGARHQGCSHVATRCHGDQFREGNKHIRPSDVVKSDDVPAGEEETKHTAVLEQLFSNHSGFTESFLISFFVLFTLIIGIPNSERTNADTHRENMQTAQEPATFLRSNSYDKKIQ